MAVSTIHSVSSSGEFNGFNNAFNPVQREGSETMPAGVMHQLLLSSQTLMTGKTHAQYQQILDTLWQCVQRGEAVPPCITFQVGQPADMHFQIPPEMLLQCRLDGVSELNKFSIHFVNHTPHYPLAKLCHLAQHRLLEEHSAIHEQIRQMMKENLDQLPGVIVNALCGEIYNDRLHNKEGMQDYATHQHSFTFGETYLTDFYKTSVATQSHLYDVADKRDRYFIAPALERWVSGQVEALQQDSVRFESFITMVKDAKKYQEVTSSLADVKGNLIKWADALVAFERAERRVAEGQASTIHLSIANLELALAEANGAPNSGVDDTIPDQVNEENKSSSTYCTIA